MTRQLIDDCFYVEESKIKTWKSYREDGSEIITSLTKENCINATRFYLKDYQDRNASDKTD